MARWGGDEFVIGMYAMSVDDGRQRVGQFIQQVATGAVGADSRRNAVTISAGLAAFPQDAEDVESLVQAADDALSVAKKSGGGRVRVAHQGHAEPSLLDVVLVEDDDVLADLLEHTLMTRGYSTKRFSDGAEAARVLAATDAEIVPCVIVLDWDLPGLDGMRVLKTLAASGTLRRSRVIMLTGRGTEGEVLKALEAGAFDHVAKPFSVPVLMQRIRRALEQHAV